jgi:dGTPase
VFGSTGALSTLAAMPEVAGFVADAFAARIREQEEQSLSPLAVRSYETRGRLHAEEECLVRTPFQRDRDRIIHSKPFRRLKGKTQVFIDPAGDHYRTRMTHTLETTGIARVVARALRLNEDLVEAIGLGHDTGHTPFGHAGEEALDAALRERFGGRFRHNEQSLRVAERLNLTHEVRDGILTHTGPRESETLEGKVVRIVDRVAYINHDIDDAIRYGLLVESDLPREEIDVLGQTGAARIDTLVHDLIETSEREGDIAQSAEVGAAMLSLRSFMFERVYLGPETRREHERARDTIRRIFDLLADRGDAADEITEFIAGMTDRFALAYAQRI